MSAQVGSILLFLALGSALYAWLAGLIGGRRNSERLVQSARNAAIITLPLLTAAALSLIGLLVRGEFNTSFVYQVSQRSMPLYLKVTALWGGQPGSLLFWSWLMSAFTAAAMLRNWDRERPLMPYVISAAMGTLAFFIALVTFWENPFARYFCLPGGFTAGGGCLGDYVQTALFDPSPLWGPVEAAWAGLAAKAPGMLGVVVKDLVSLTAPVGATAVFPADGQGLNPLLRHPGMVIHPPMLYLGFVSFVIPYSFAMASLMGKDVSDSWIRTTRRWTLIGWLFLALGLILGGWWAYDVLGWGGYWGWDPVENAALLPWLTATPFLHSVMIEEKRGMLRRWNMVLIIVTYLLVVLGTFATRSGFVASVHAFSQGAIGPLFALFLASALIISTKLVIDRWDSLKGDHELDSLVSRESFFLAQNLLFLCLAFTVALGSYWPVVTELLSTMRGLGVEKASLGPEWYNTVTAPLWLAIIFLMGIAPLAAWHRASLKRIGRAIIYPAAAAAVLTVIAFLLGARSAYALLAYALVFLSGAITLFEYHRGAIARVSAHGESYPRALWSLFGRNRRRYGGYLIHLGVVIMAVGVISSNAFKLETQQQLSVGERMQLGGYILEYQSMDPYVATDGRQVYSADTVVYTPDGREVARLNPRNDEFITPDNKIQPMTIPGQYTTLTGDDFYVLLAARAPIPGQPLRMMDATFKIYYNPLVNWVWTGGFIFVVGTLVAAWPDFSEERRAVAEAELRRSRPLRPAPAAGD